MLTLDGKTPTQGEAIQQFSEIFRRPAGCFLNIEEPDSVDSALARWGTPEDIDLIVVTDGEAVRLADPYSHDR